MAGKPKSELEGRTIKTVRAMTRQELEAEGWTEDRHGARIALVLDNGTVLYPSRDDEGNGPGALFGVTKDGKTIAFVAPQKG